MNIEYSKLYQVNVSIYCKIFLSFVISVKIYFEILLRISLWIENYIPEQIRDAGGVVLQTERGCLVVVFQER